MACSLLVHEILLTRICALRLYFHFAFLVISNCLLGMGASGALLTLLGERIARAPRKWLTRGCVGYAVTLCVTYLVLLGFPLPNDIVLNNPAHLLGLSLWNLAGAAPFVFGGGVVGMLLSADAATAHRLYATDLVLAAVGCMLCPWLLPHVGAGGVFLVTVVLALGASFAAAESRVLRGVCAAGACFALVLLPTFDRTFPVPSKGFIDFARRVEGSRKLGAPYSVWTANSRIDLIRMPKEWPLGMFMRGKNRAGMPPDPPSAGIAQDAVAGTTLVDYSEHPEALEFLRRSMYVAAYRLYEHPDVLVIGLGGGNDVWAARDAGAKHVKAIELNWPIVAAHKGIMRRYSQVMTDDPRVEIVVDEGRSALMREHHDYDVVQMTGIDTWTALASGAYVLAENYLYTRQAIASMYRRLRPGGVLQISRFSATMEALRLLSNIRAALASEGVRDVTRSISVLSSDDMMMAVQVKKGDFSLEEQNSTLRFAEQVGIKVDYLPNHPGRGAVTTFLRSPNPQQIIDEFPMNIGPTDDDRPYFFNYLKWQHPLDSLQHLGDIPSVSQGNPVFLFSQLVFSILASALLVVGPLAWRARRSSERIAKGAGRYLAYFASLGLGFVLIEVAVIQKLTLFLGQPVYSLTTTLLSLLFFTGLGSLVFAGRLDTRSRRVWLVPAAIVLGIALFCGVAQQLVRAGIAWPLPVRLVAAALSLAPLALALGIPFAYGLRRMHTTHASLVPWAWAINGSFSVIGSVLTVIVSMTFGFYAVLALAACVYVLGFAALLTPARAPAESAARPTPA
ncbi:MAG TPA: hypothetical protein VHM19_19345 [Polyangiales bacterium]|nr:hypothetical protein [Polyangiales bacterium]